MQDIYIFTYGTLKRGVTNHYFLIEDAVFVSNAITCEKYQMYPCTSKKFPFLIICFSQKRTLKLKRMVKTGYKKGNSIALHIFIAVEFFKTLITFMFSATGLYKF